MSDKMNPLNFCYWLQGFAEMHSIDEDFSPTPDQWKIIQYHLQLVFDKVTPDYTNTSVKPVESEEVLKDVLREIREDKIWTNEQTIPFEPGTSVI